MTSVIPVDLSFLGRVTQCDIRAQLNLVCLSILNCKFAFKKIGISDIQKSATMWIHHPFGDEISPFAVYIEFSSEAIMIAVLSCLTYNAAVVL